MDDALRRRLDALVALPGLAAVFLAALAGARNVAPLVGAVLVWLAALAAVWIIGRRGGGLEVFWLGADLLGPPDGFGRRRLDVFPREHHPCPL